MARSIEQIQAEIIQAKEGNSTLAQLNSTSKVAVWRLITYVMAVAIYTLEVLFDLHKAETDNKIAILKPHTQRWYRQKALSFQYGYHLATDADYYNNDGIDDTLIEQSKIIKYSAVTEATGESRVIIKIATETADELSPITPEQKQAFDAYIFEIKDAGVNVSTINFLPDRLYLTMRIYYDPLVLDEQGNSILSGGRPVEEAIKAYLKEMPFDGELVLAHLVDRLQTVEGVRIPHIDNAESSWIDNNTNDYGTPQPINVKKVPVSGYFKVVDFSRISYVV
ncbi:hypothetical protein [Pedobacter sp. ASV28]|jgi:hypothetical protein|uniref:hypothetical protein n=1 Tax=Pedobacter sp. ASV28 TaxID=2795123 RepID=UPI0018ED054A|nr:hypothetical protein [Pedobacter sp. ASV28]